VLVAFVLFLAVVPASDHTVLVVNNMLQTLSALVAALVCSLVALRGAPRRRSGWAFMGVALAGWGLGQGYWSWSEIVAQNATPFPSFADLGFLVFPVAGAVAVVLFQSGTSASRSRLRAASDGLIVASSLFIISWTLVLADVFSAGGDSTFAFAISLAYPIGDLVVVALALLLLSRQTSDRLPMALLSAGLISMALADGGFTYLTASDSYHTGSVIDVGWVAAFLLCAVAAVADSEGRKVGDSQSQMTRFGVLLPLLPVAVGMGFVVVQAWRSEMDHALVVSGGVLIALVVGRQLLVLAENTTLVTTVRQREEQLRYQAFHDPLTGLANRLLFRDRLEHAAILREREPAPLTVLFLDLDDFKLVNDRLGHAAGDALLVDVAERLRACLRKGDTVARLGGDEFAVLLEDADQPPVLLAERIVAAMDVPFQLGQHRAQVSGSVGVATVDTFGEPAAVADQLLHRADVAMYAAKHRSKGSFVVYSEGMKMITGSTAAAVDESADSAESAVGAAS
jgi:diguanylate cyclase (GGDEF)-like protein